MSFTVKIRKLWTSEISQECLLCGDKSKQRSGHVSKPHNFLLAVCHGYFPDNLIATGPPIYFPATSSQALDVERFLHLLHSNSTWVTMQKAVQLQFINTVKSFLLDSFGRLVEDSLPLLANNTLRERLLRVNQDYRKFVTDQQAWNDLLGDSSRPIQWRSYNLSGMRFFSKWFNFL